MVGDYFLPYLYDQLNSSLLYSPLHYSSKLQKKIQMTISPSLPPTRKMAGAKFLARVMKRGFSKSAFRIDALPHAGGSSLGRCQS
jgi:hypothetical protein